MKLLLIASIVIAGIAATAYGRDMEAVCHKYDFSYYHMYGRKSAPVLMDALISPFRHTSRSEVLSAYKRYTVPNLYIPVSIFSGFILVLAVILWFMFCCFGCCGNKCCCCAKERDAYNPRVRKCSRIFFYIFCVTAIVFASMAISGISDMTDGYEETECAVGTALTQIMEPNSRLQGSWRTWAGTKTLLANIKKIISSMDGGISAFKDYSESYDQKLYEREGELMQYISKDINGNFEPRRALNPETGEEDVKPCHIAYLPEHVQNITSVTQYYMVTSLAWCNKSKEASDYIVNNYNKEDIVDILDRIENYHGSLQNDSVRLWRGLDKAVDPIRGNLKGGFLSLEITQIVVIALLMALVPIAFCCKNCSCFYHFAYCCLCFYMLLSVIVLLVFFPFVTFMSDACYFMDNTVTPSQSFYDLARTSEDKENLKRLYTCFYEGGDLLSNEWNLTEKLKFGTDMIAAYKYMKYYVNHAMDAADVVYQIKEKVATSDDNLHLEESVYPINDSIHRLNQLTHKFESESKYPDCDSLVDVWKLNSNQCDSPKYQVDGPLGTPSCLRVENWNETLFTKRYTVSNIKCGEPEAKIAAIKQKYDLMNGYASSVHKIYWDLENSLVSYRDMLADTADIENTMLLKLKVAMTIVSDLVKVIGDEYTGFIASTNCGFLLDIYKRIYYTVCSDFLSGAKRYTIFLIFTIIASLAATVFVMKMISQNRKESDPEFVAPLIQPYIPPVVVAQVPTCQGSTPA